MTSLKTSRFSVWNDFPLCLTARQGNKVKYFLTPVGACAVGMNSKPRYVKTRDLSIYSCSDSCSKCNIRFKYVVPRSQTDDHELIRQTDRQTDLTNCLTSLFASRAWGNDDNNDEGVLKSEASYSFSPK